MAGKPRYTFHYTPVEYFDSLDPAEDYVPPGFEREGFIHCTDGAENMAEVANAIYKDDPRRFYALYIDKMRVRSPIKYEDAQGIYPHIYGSLNRDAIVERREALRLPDGKFLPMPEIPDTSSP
jgi:uncharacterized protein (DUF952 family)